MPTVLDDTFAALADPARRSILQRLASGPATAGDLSEPFAISRPAVSRHLRVLREAGLVSARSEGRERWYALEGEQLEAAEEWLHDMQRLWAAALDAYKRFVEEGEEDGDGI